MPRGSRKFDLVTAEDILRASLVIPNNKVYCGEALAVVHGTTSAITLSEPCRRIIVTIDSGAGDTHGIWFSWGTDRTNRTGGRVLVSSGRPLDILLDEPEDQFFVRRVRTSGTINVGIVAVP